MDGEMTPVKITRTVFHNFLWLIGLMLGPPPRADSGWDNRILLPRGCRPFDIFECPDELARHGIHAGQESYDNHLMPHLMVDLDCLRCLHLSVPRYPGTPHGCQDPTVPVS
jgi:hypothetical protein